MKSFLTYINEEEEKKRPSSYLMKQFDRIADERQPSFSPGIFSGQIARYSEKHARQLMKNNPNHYNINMGAVAHHSIAKENLNNYDDNVRMRIAEKHRDLAGHLINDESGKVRTTVAGYPEYAHHFVNDENIYTKMMAARHPKTTHLFINDPDTRIRSTVARNASVDVAEKMVNDPAVSVRSTILLHHPKLAHHFLNDEDSVMRADARDAIDYDNEND